jgi:hypothetical protein
VYFEDIRNSDEVCSNVVPLDELSADLGSSGPARFVWITPNLCNDAHDCDISVGDAFLAEIVPTFLETFGPNDLLVITYDEGQTDDGCCGVPGGGHIPTVLAGPAAREGAESSQPYTLYSILRTVEDGFGLPLLGHAGDAQTKPMADLIAGRPND